MEEKVKYEVVEEFGTFSYKGNGTKQARLRMISWNGRVPQYDLRIWGVGMNGTEMPYKGFTVGREDLETLRDLIDAALMEGEG